LVVFSLAARIDVQNDLVEVQIQSTHQPNLSVTSDSCEYRGLFAVPLFGAFLRQVCTTRRFSTLVPEVSRRKPSVPNLTQTASTLLGDKMRHPLNVCAHCENGRDPVTKNNGFNFTHQMVDGVIVEVYLHDGCVNPWCQAFNVPLPDKAIGGGTKPKSAGYEHT
jgi:hypothetical protein